MTRFLTFDDSRPRNECRTAFRPCPPFTQQLRRVWKEPHVNIAAAYSFLQLKRWRTFNGNAQNSAGVSLIASSRTPQVQRIIKLLNPQPWKCAHGRIIYYKRVLMSFYGFWHVCPAYFSISTFKKHSWLPNKHILAYSL